MFETHTDAQIINGSKTIIQDEKLIYSSKFLVAYIDSCQVFNAFFSFRFFYNIFN